MGQQARFDHGRRTINLPADREVTTKAVRPTAEAIGGDIAKSERKIQLGAFALTAVIEERFAS